MTIRITSAIIAGALIVVSCGRQVAPQPPLFSMPYTSPTNGAPTLSHGEVLAKFRAMASASEIQEFERLSAATDSDSQTHAMEMVLFKLTTEELFQIGINQNEYDGHFDWWLATERDGAADDRAFWQALRRVGVSPSGFHDLSMVGWSVPREQFFKAHRALLSAGLNTNEFKICEPRFSLQ